LIVVNPGLATRRGALHFSYTAEAGHFERRDLFILVFPAHPVNDN
jgi:hypothetical protein